MDERTEGLLINLIEEANEISQMAAKCLRFGMYSYNPEDPERLSNTELLGLEIGNLQHMMRDNRDIYSNHIAAGNRAKKIRLLKYPLLKRGQ